MQLASNNREVRKNSRRVAGGEILSDKVRERVAPRNVVKAAGAGFSMNEEDLKHQIRHARYRPQRRDTYFQYVA